MDKEMETKRKKEQRKEGSIYHPVTFRDGENAH